MKSRRFAVLIACSCLMANVAHATGTYAGFDSDNEGGRMSFLGIQGGNRLTYELFAGNLDYQYLDSGATVKVNQQIITPTVGLSTSGPWILSAAAGPTFNIKEKDNGSSKVKNTGSGAVVKIGLASYQHEITRELLGSYSTIDKFIWTRARIKQRLIGAFSLGGELFWMGNNDADSAGAGMLFDLSGKRGNVTFKVGYKRSTNDKPALYGGLDAFMSF